MTAEDHVLRYGQGTIEFRLERRPRDTLSISVDPDLTVSVVAPLNATLEKIYEKVRKRSPWIVRQTRYFQGFYPRTPERRYVSGETHMYLGRQYRLKVLHDLQKSVKLLRGKLVVRTPRHDRAEEVGELVRGWYRERAGARFPERILVCKKRFPRNGDFEPAGLAIRHLKQRWGSMTSRGQLVLNPSLLRASIDAVDYVVTHELCHLRYQNHGRDFVDLLTKVMPDWEARKAKLEKQLA